MSTNVPFVYLNGQWVCADEAKVSVTDRGFLLGDGVYEVIPVFDGCPFYLVEHIKRLYRSLAAIRLVISLTQPDWIEVAKQLIKKNASKDGSIYIQVTRGPSAVRRHAFPTQSHPTLLAMMMPSNSQSLDTLQQGISVIVLPDSRWSHCAIKAIALLPNVLLNQTAKDKGVDEAILLRDGWVTEGTTSNVFLVEKGVIYTPPSSDLLLGGITRDLIITLAHEQGLPLKQASIDLARLQAADEIWLSSSGYEIRPVVSLDGKPVGSGKAGQCWEKMVEYYQRHKADFLQRHAQKKD